MNNIVEEIKTHLTEYELDGIEITEEDANLVLSYIKEGIAKDKAIEKVLIGIREVLSTNWEY